MHEATRRYERWGQEEKGNTKEEHDVLSDMILARCMCKVVCWKKPRISQTVTTQLKRRMSPQIFSYETLYFYIVIITFLLFI